MLPVFSQTANLLLERVRHLSLQHLPRKTHSLRQARHPAITVVADPQVMLYPGRDRLRRLAIDEVRRVFLDLATVAHSIRARIFRRVFFISSDQSVDPRRAAAHFDLHSATD